MRTRWLLWGLLSSLGCGGESVRWYQQCPRSQKQLSIDLPLCSVKAGDPCSKAGAACFDLETNYTMVCASDEPRDLCAD